jgi:Lon protease-like protein
MVVTPQFPLGTVLFPSMVLPLHVFEPRYRAMVADVMAGDRQFGVVLIERGLEVGGDDHRSSLGTLARVVQAEELSDGRWALMTVGVERFKVVRWLPDDPYPVADIEAWPDEAPDADLGAVYHEVVAKFRRCMALASEAGLNVGPVPDTTDDAELGSLHMSARAPVGPFDKQRLLGAPGPAPRLDLLSEMIDGATEILLARLGDS